MLSYIFVGFILSLLAGIAYQTFVTPRQWMRQHGDGNYSPIRQAYRNASKQK